MKIRTISTKELREDFSKVKAAMKAGQSLVLMYRSRPLAEIKPFKQKQQKLRTFSLREIKKWIADDQLTDEQQKKVKKIINRLP